MYGWAPRSPPPRESLPIYVSQFFSAPYSFCARAWHRIWSICGACKHHCFHQSHPRDFQSHSRSAHRSTGQRCFSFCFAVSLFHIEEIMGRYWLVLIVLVIFFRIRIHRSACRVSFPLVTGISLIFYGRKKINVLINGVSYISARRAAREYGYTP